MRLRRLGIVALGHCGHAYARAVFAHFMVGFTYQYGREDWRDDITLAKASGIDAFALNVGSNEWQLARVLDAYKVALAADFKVFISLDMSSLNSSADMVRFIAPTARLGAQYLHEGRPFVSTFAGEALNFGAASVSAGWQAALRDVLPGLDLCFVPMFSLDPATAVSSNPVVDGIARWQAWSNDASLLSTDVDVAYQTDAIRNGKLDMATVSPVFYTHISAAKNWLYATDADQWGRRWEQLSALKPPPDFVQIVSWCVAGKGSELTCRNDWTESHGIGPVRAKSVDPAVRWALFDVRRSELRRADQRSTRPGSSRSHTTPSSTRPASRPRSRPIESTSRIGRTASLHSSRMTRGAGLSALTLWPTASTRPRFCGRTPTSHRSPFASARKRRLCPCDPVSLALALRSAKASSRSVYSTPAAGRSATSTRACQSMTRLSRSTTSTCTRSR